MTGGLYRKVCPGMSTRPRSCAVRISPRAIVGRRGERLLDEDVLARLERAHREVVVGRHRRDDADRIEL